MNIKRAKEEIERTTKVIPIKSAAQENIQI